MTAKQTTPSTSGRQRPLQNAGQETHIRQLVDELIQSLSAVAATSSKPQPVDLPEREARRPPEEFAA